MVLLGSLILYLLDQKSSRMTLLSQDHGGSVYLVER